MKIARLALRLALILPLVLMPLVLLAITERPVPPLDYPGFDTCVLPCWAGIIPNETYTLDSPQVMAANLAGAELEFSQVVTQINFTVASQDRFVEGAIYDDRGLVNSLRLMMSLPLWRLIDILGTPACVRNQTGSSGEGMVTIWWVIGNHTVSSTLLVDSTSWSPSANVFTLGSSQQPETCTSPLLKPWRGFAPLWFYGSS